MEDDKMLNIAAILLLVGVVIVYLFGILYIASGSFQSYHETFMGGLTAEGVTTFNANLMVLIGVFIRIIGFSFLGIATLWLYLIVKPLREGDKLVWVINLVCVLLVPLPITLLTAVVGGTPFYVALIVLLMDLAAVVLAAKPCLAE